MRAGFLPTSRDFVSAPPLSRWPALPVASVQRISSSGHLVRVPPAPAWPKLQKLVCRLPHRHMSGHLFAHAGQSYPGYETLAHYERWLTCPRPCLPVQVFAKYLCVSYRHAAAYLHLSCRSCRVPARLPLSVHVRLAASPNSLRLLALLDLLVGPRPVVPLWALW